jgi:hypothetical protein
VRLFLCKLIEHISYAKKKRLFGASVESGRSLASAYFGFELKSWVTHTGT